MNFSSLESWASFSEQAMSKYALDMSGLDEAYDAECVEYFTLSSAWRELTRTQVITNPIVVKGDKKTNQAIVQFY